MRIFICLILSFSLFSIELHAQGLPGSGNCASGFNQGYIDIPNFPQLQMPLTIMAWVKTPPSPSPGVFPNIFSSAQSTPSSGYVGFWLAFSDASTNPQISFSISNGGGCFHSACRRTYTAQFPAHLFNQWVHLAVIISSPTQAQIFINGVSMSITTSGNQNINSIKYPTSAGGNLARIGASMQNILHRYNGEIDELSIWNVALTPSQVQGFMCKKTPPTTPGLIAYYKFDEPNATVPVQDASTPQYNGTTAGGGPMTRPFSGAPIGDESDYTYSLGTMPTLHHSNTSGDSIFATLSPANAQGLHFYTVNARPNHLNGFAGDTNTAFERYYGYYVVQNAPSQNHLVSVNAYSNPGPISLHHRLNNAESIWDTLPIVPSGSGLNFNFTEPTTEFIFGMESGISVNLFDRTDVRIFPNPSKGFITIENIPESLSGLQISVFDVQGKIIKTQNFQTNESTVRLDLSQLAPGEYFIYLNHPLGRMIKSILIMN